MLGAGNAGVTVRDRGAERPGPVPIRSHRALCAHCLVVRLTDSACVSECVRAALLSPVSGVSRSVQSFPCSKPPRDPPLKGVAPCGESEAMGGC